MIGFQWKSSDILLKDKRTEFQSLPFDEPKIPFVSLRWKIPIKSEVFCNFAPIFASTGLIPKQFKWRANIENDFFCAAHFF